MQATYKILKLLKKDGYIIVRCCILNTCDLFEHEQEELGN